LLARLNIVSDDYAYYFITGETKLAGQFAGDKRILAEKQAIARVLIRDYLIKVSDVNAMRAGLHMLQCALKTRAFNI